MFADVQSVDEWFPNRGGILLPGLVSVSEHSLVALYQLCVCGRVMVINASAAVTIIENHPGS